MIQNISDTDFQAVSNVIDSHIGLNFPEERRTLLARGLALASAEFGFENLKEFIAWLRNTILNKDQTEKLASCLTVNETFFWREPNVFDAITNEIIPEIIEQKKDRDRKIRIWSVGCSTGEEPYSLAIALHKTIPDIKNWDIKVIATDVNPKVIDKARAGKYGQWSFRNSPAWLKKSYFRTCKNSKYEIIPEIKNLVSFSVLNLADPYYRGINSQMDIIFCRNVLMYFTDVWICRISDRLYHSLTENGWFVVSSCELGSRLYSRYETVQFQGAMLYRRRRRDFSESDYTVDDKFIFKSDFNSKVSKSNDAGLSVIHEYSSQSLSALAGEVADPSVTSMSPGISVTDTPVQQITSEFDTLPENITLIQSLANRGDLNEALGKCNSAINSFKLSSELYQLKASILIELDKASEAVMSLRQAIYLNPNDLMCHFALGRLFFKEGNVKNARRYFSNVLGLVENYKDDLILPESEGLSVREIREIVVRNLQTVLKNE